MGELYLRIPGENDTNPIVAAKKVYIRANEAGHPIKRAKQIWIRPGNDLLQAWEDDPAQFLIDHPTDNPQTDSNYWNWKPVWSMAVNYHFSENNVQTIYVKQGAAIGNLMTGPTKEETFSGETITRTFYGWTRNSAGSETQLIDENYVVNSSIDLYPLYDYIITFKYNNEVIERRVVKRHEMLGEVPVIEGVNDENKVWRYTSNNYTKYYDATTRITEDRTVVPATDIQIVFDLNGSGIITNQEKFYISEVWGDTTYGAAINNAPVPNAEGYGDSYVENEEYDFKHTGKIFLGWYTAQEGGRKLSPEISTEIRTDKIFYAHWKDNISFKQYALRPNGLIKVGKATLLDSNYGAAEDGRVMIYQDFPATSSKQIYGVKEVSNEVFFANEFTDFQLFTLDSDSEYHDERYKNVQQYYRNYGFFENEDLSLQLSIKNQLTVDGVKYTYTVQKDKPLYWTEIDLKTGNASSNNFTTLTKNDFTWKANTDFDKMFDFSAGKIIMLSSINPGENGNNILTYVPSYYNNTFYNQTTGYTFSDSDSAAAMSLSVSSIEAPKDGQCWKSWVRDESNYITNAAPRNKLRSTYGNLWGTKTLTLPTGDNPTWTWEIRNESQNPSKSPYSTTYHAAIHEVCPHHYDVFGTMRGDNPSEVKLNQTSIYNISLDVPTTVGQGSYTFNDLISYSQIKLTAYDENEKYYNSFTKNIYVYQMNYSYFPNHDSTSRITTLDQSYLISNYIPIKPALNNYYYPSSEPYTTKIFDHWVNNSTNYSPGDYFQGNTNITEDKVITMSAFYVNKFNITLSTLGLTANSHTNTLTWNEVYANDDNTERAAWYKVIGTDSNNQTVVLSNISGYTDGFIPASVAANGQITLITNSFDHTIVKVRVVAYNSDKTLYNSFENSITWYKLHFTNNYSTNISYMDVYRLQGETVGTLPTVSSTREGYSFDGWYRKGKSDGIVVITDDEITSSTILSNITQYYVDGTYYREAAPKWTQVAYTVTFDNSYAYYNNGTNRMSAGSYTSCPALTGYTITLPTPQANPTQNRDNGTSLSWIFKGWYTSTSNFMGSIAENVKYTPTGSGSFVGNAGDSYTPSGNITLYGRWELNQYAITFNYGYDNIISVQYTDYDNEVQLEDITREDYEFLGWFSSAEGGTQYEDSWQAFTDSTTLYAHWEAPAPACVFYDNNNNLIATRPSNVVLLNSGNIECTPTLINGEYNGEVKYSVAIYENTGTTSSPVYSRRWYRPLDYPVEGNDIVYDANRNKIIIKMDTNSLTDFVYYIYDLSDNLKVTVEAIDSQNNRLADVNTNNGTNNLFVLKTKTFDLFNSSYPTWFTEDSITLVGPEDGTQGLARIIGTEGSKQLTIRALQDTEVAYVDYRIRRQDYNSLLYYLPFVTTYPNEVSSGDFFVGWDFRSYTNNSSWTSSYYREVSKHVIGRSNAEANGTEITYTKLETINAVTGLKIITHATMPLFNSASITAYGTIYSPTISTTENKPFIRKRANTSTSTATTYYREKLFEDVTITLTKNGDYGDIEFNVPSSYYSSTSTKFVPDSIALYIDGSYYGNLYTDSYTSGTKIGFYDVYLYGASTLTLVARCDYQASDSFFNRDVNSVIATKTI